MAFLIVMEKGQPDRVFSLRGHELIVGRSREAGLILPNVSVSREHAMLRRSAGGGWVITDLDSQNGLMLRGEKVSVQVLSTGDTVVIGKFALKYIGADMQPAMHDDQLLEDLPRYTTSRVGQEDSTYQLSPALVKKLQQSRDLLNRGIIVAAHPAEGAWRPGEASVSFGPGGKIPVLATFARGVVAEVVWRDGFHAILRKSRLVKLEVNGKAVNERRLDPDDQITIGSSSFFYRVSD